MDASVQTVSSRDTCLVGAEVEHRDDQSSGSNIEVKELSGEGGRKKSTSGRWIADGR